ncbi:TonB-dependent receptor [Denitratisoma oestradiolicum]|uniref:Iron complex outermembrane recepter protein n=1 Tax=Denitratisoma oestradiolicum TaxID=311182 RepID=A0A6S6XNJ1_9PROT|nr:TonB-dependent receptor [Denitratisoma oestradiolicum]TWO79736.1 hypothetical protein CBW56_13415 [Denitratisoma oestradiolicum]CAB1367501.1 Iron complex outermembrane recepter protein [Denitratisoma oestradiolicum]
MNKVSQVLPRGFAQRGIPLLVAGLFAGQAWAADAVGAGLEEIVVTAQKRAEKLQDVPLAISAYSVQQLEARGVQTTKDLSALAPNLQISESQAEHGSVKIAMRGSSLGNTPLFQESMVGVYIDGVFIGKPSGQQFDLLDVERVEVLRGPQGTLYGRNTMAGALSFVTRKPTGQFGGAVGVDVGNYGKLATSLSMDLPRMGIASVSFGYRENHRNGLVKTLPGSPVSSLDSLNTQSGRLAMNLDISSTLQFDYRYDTNSRNDRPPLGQLTYVAPNALGGFLDYYGAGGYSKFASTERQTTAGANIAVFERDRTEGHSATLNWDIDPNNTLKAIVSYRHTRGQGALDIDGTNLSVLDNSPFHSSYAQRSQEFQWVGHTDRWKYVTGLYFFQDQGSTHDRSQSFPLWGVPAAIDKYTFESRSSSWYGQADYQTTEALTLTAGLRYNREHKQLSRYTIDDAGMGAGGWAGGVPPTDSSKEFSATTPMLTAAYKFNSQTNGYARYAEGFRTGGFNGTASTPAEASRPYAPEKAKSYELGLKWTSEDNRLQINSALFMSKTTDKQVVVFNAGAGGVPLPSISNAGKATSSGLELEAAYAPSDTMRLQGSLGFLRSKYDSYIINGIDEASNWPVGQSPRFNMTLAMDAHIAKTAWGTLRGMLDYTYQSEMQSMAGQKARPGDALYRTDQPTDEEGNIAAAGFWNGKLLLKGIPMGHDSFGEVSLWVRNITDKQHIAGRIVIPQIGRMNLGYWDEPRTYGASFSYRW